MTDEIKAIRERCEREKVIEATGRKANRVYLDTVPSLLTEIDRLTAELFGKTEQLEAAKSELLQKTQLLDASQRRERLAVELLVKSGFCSQQPLYECDEERPAACHACITKWCLSGPQEWHTKEEQHEI